MTEQRWMHSEVGLRSWGANAPRAEPVPQQIMEAAAAHDLGAAVSTGQCVRAGPHDRAVDCLVTGALCGVIGFVILAVVGGSGHFGPPFMVLFFGAATASFVYSFSQFCQPDHRLSLWFCQFDRGFAYLDAAEPVRVFRWSDITVLRNITDRYVNGAYQNTTYHYTVYGQDGKPYQLYEVGRRDSWIGRVGEIIEKEVTRAQLPRAAVAIEGGRRLSFGDLDIDARGVTGKQGTLFWNQVEQVRVHQGYVTVKKAGKWLGWSNQPVSRIPNVFVFLALARILQEHAR